MDEFRQELQKILDRIKLIESAALRIISIAFPDDRGSLKVPKYDGDPASPEDGQIWYDSTAHKFRKRVNGTSSDLT